jgi:large subunit ribosomal protein L9
MEVILKQDIPSLGYANDLVKVKDGYARNYLIPKGMAIMATSSSKKVLAESVRQKSYKEDKIRKEAEELAKAIEGITVKVGAKAAETGKIYGSVNNIQIADAIKDQFKYDIDRRKIYIDGESIKELGTYTAQLNLYKDIKAKIYFEVISE